MTKKILLCAISIFALQVFNPTLAKASDFNVSYAQEFYSNCSTSPTPATNDSNKKVEKLLALSTCISYINGYIDSVYLAKRIYDDKGMNEMSLCLPENGISNGDVLSIFLAYLEKNQISKEQRTSVLLHVALAEKYKCM